MISCQQNCLRNLGEEARPENLCQEYEAALCSVLYPAQIAPLPRFPPHPSFCPSISNFVAQEFWSWVLWGYEKLEGKLRNAGITYTISSAGLIHYNSIDKFLTSLEL